MVIVTHTLAKPISKHLIFSLILDAILIYHLIRGIQYVDRDLPIDLKGTVVDRMTLTLADSIQCKSSE